MKRGGGHRQIDAPIPKLAALQRQLGALLYDCVSELEQGVPSRKTLAHGFAKSRSIVTNASLHKRRRYVLNLDLENFFPTINFGRVRGFFIKDKYFSLDPKVATVIAQIACYGDDLPQGAPSSPVISNLIGHLLDSRLARFAKHYKCTYSRYADDLTFSTNQKIFPSALASLTPGSLDDWVLGDELIQKIENSGFQINHRKTRMQLRGSRQIVTGLNVNEKVNIRPEYYRTARSMCFELFSTGAYYQMVPAIFSGGGVEDPPVKKDETSLAPLEGILSHIYEIRNTIDRRSSKEKKSDPTATLNLYRRFLFFKNFVALQHPLILTEGKTDALYLKAALPKLVKFHPRLGQFTGKKFSSELRYMNYTRVVHEVLQLGGGTGDLKHFILKYVKTFNSFKKQDPLHPVILLIDNDEGAKDIFAIIKPIIGKVIDWTSTDLFYHLYENVYLIKTLENGVSGKSCIEDSFDATVLATELEGKKFDPNKETGVTSTYGKIVFAEKVVKPNAATINFGNFSGLFDRIVAVLDHFYA